MKNFFKDRQSQILIGLTVLFIAIIGGFLVWGFDIIITNFNLAFISRPASNDVQFKIDDAKKILGTRTPILQ